jgi:hypothetical protein
MKVCGKCKNTKPATTEFFSRKASSKDGLRSYCKECGSEYTRSWKEKNPDHQKQYQAKNKEIISRKKKEYRRANKEKIQQYNAAWRESNPDYHKKWDQENREKRREAIRKYHGTRRVHDTGFRVSQNFSRSIRYCLSRSGSSKYGKNWERLVGYTRHELINHIEKQFKVGMSWENWGEWHIDHIVPIKSFNIKEAGDQEFLACWSLTNLRPIWASENVRKSAKRIYLL